LTAAGSTTIGLLAIGTIAIKSAGPLALGARQLPPRVAGFIGLLAPALLTALVAVDTFTGTPHHLVIDARAAGLLAAGVALMLRVQIVAVVVTAAVATALVRAVS
jgi:branched-subunit amino acid transport protein